MRQKLFAVCLGTALLLAVVIGSGVMGERLAAGKVAIAMLANTLATVGDLSVLQVSTKVRSGYGQWIAEGVATFGLLLVILDDGVRRGQ